jgi:hypothetical protein
MSTIPFNTGKVQIGCMYNGQRPPHHDADALKLQSALTGRAAPIDTDGITIVLVVGVLIAVLVVASWMGVWA